MVSLSVFAFDVFWLISLLFVFYVCFCMCFIAFFGGDVYLFACYICVCVVLWLFVCVVASLLGVCVFFSLGKGVFVCCLFLCCPVLSCFLCLRFLVLCLFCVCVVFVSVLLLLFLYSWGYLIVVCVCFCVDVSCSPFAFDGLLCDCFVLLSVCVFLIYGLVCCCCCFLGAYVSLLFSCLGVFVCCLCLC